MRVSVNESIILKKSVDLRRYVTVLPSLYKLWHPSHKSFEYLQQTPTTRGSLFIFEEQIGKTNIRVKGIIISCSPKSVTWLSNSRIVKIGGSLKIIEKEMQQEVYFELSVVFYLLGRILGRTITRQQLSEHVQEELAQMKRIMESRVKSFV